MKYNTVIEDSCGGSDSGDNDDDKEEDVDPIALKGF